MTPSGPCSVCKEMTGWFYPDFNQWFCPKHEPVSSATTAGSEFEIDPGTTDRTRFPWEIDEQQPHAPNRAARRKK